MAPAGKTLDLSGVLPSAPSSEGTLDTKAPDTTAGSTVAAPTQDPAQAAVVGPDADTAASPQKPLAPSHTLPAPAASISGTQVTPAAHPSAPPTTVPGAGHTTPLVLERRCQERDQFSAPSPLTALPASLNSGAQGRCVLPPPLVVPQHQRLPLQPSGSGSMTVSAAPEVSTAQKPKKLRPGVLDSPAVALKAGAAAAAINQAAREAAGDGPLPTGLLANEALFPGCGYHIAASPMPAGMVGPKMAGHKLRMFWPRDSTYYVCDCLEYVAGQRRPYVLKYKDGDKETVSLGAHNWMLDPFDEGELPHSPRTLAKLNKDHLTQWREETASQLPEVLAPLVVSAAASPPPSLTPTLRHHASPAALEAVAAMLCAAATGPQKGKPPGKPPGTDTAATNSAAKRKSMCDTSADSMPTSNKRRVAGNISHQQSMEGAGGTELSKPNTADQPPVLSVGITPLHRGVLGAGSNKADAAASVGMQAAAIAAKRAATTYRPAPGQAPAQHGTVGAVSNNTPAVAGVSNCSPMPSTARPAAEGACPTRARHLASPTAQTESISAGDVTTAPEPISGAGDGRQAPASSTGQLGTALPAIAIAASNLPMDASTGAVKVVCGRRAGDLLLSHQLIACSCAECTERTDDLRRCWSPVAYEAHGGRSERKYWKRSIVLAPEVPGGPPGPPLGPWLHGHGITILPVSTGDRYLFLTNAEVEACLAQPLKLVPSAPAAAPRPSQHRPQGRPPPARTYRTPLASTLAVPKLGIVRSARREALAQAEAVGVDKHQSLPAHLQPSSRHDRLQQYPFGELRHGTAQQQRSWGSAPNGAWQERAVELRHRAAEQEQQQQQQQQDSRRAGSRSCQEISEVESIPLGSDGTPLSSSDYEEEGRQGSGEGGRRHRGRSQMRVGYASRQHQQLQQQAQQQHGHQGAANDMATAWRRGQQQGAGSQHPLYRIEGDGYQILRCEDPPGFEILSLMPGYLLDEVSIKAWDSGTVLIHAQPRDQKAATLWGMQVPVRREVKLPKRVRADSAQALMTLHGQLYVRVDDE